MATKFGKKSKWNIKDQLEILEAIFTIIVSVMAIWGTLVAWENGFLHKVKYIADRMHADYVASDVVKNSEKEITKVKQYIEKQL